MATKPAARPAVPARPVARPAAPAARPGASTAVARPAAHAVGKPVNYGDVPSNAGMENADRDSFAIPFLQVLQKMSPQLDRNAPEYIKNAKEGDIYNTANGEVYDGGEGIILIPVNFKRSFVAWLIREKGGGFKGEYQPTDPIVVTTVRDDKNRNLLPDNNGIQLVDTRLHAVILLNGENPQPALLTTTPTQIKKSKRWMTQMQELQSKDQLPTFAHAYKFTTVPESNDRGSWMGWQIDYAQPVAEQEQIDASISFYKAMQTGAAKMRVDPATAPGGGGDE